jgi:hypothetical protein
MRAAARHSQLARTRALAVLGGAVIAAAGTHAALTGSSVAWMAVATAALAGFLSERGRPESPGGLVSRCEVCRSLGPRRDRSTVP